MDIAGNKLGSHFPESKNAKSTLAPAGLFSNNCNAFHKYLESGVYDVSLTVTDANGCTATLVNQNMITVLESPEALFTMSDNEVSILEPTIYFYDKSIGADEIATFCNQMVVCNFRIQDEASV